MPRSYPPEFRCEVLDLLKAGRTVQQVAADLQISDQTIYNWRRQERIDAGLEPGVTSSDQAALVASGVRSATCRCHGFSQRVPDSARPHNPAFAHVIHKYRSFIGGRY